MGDFWRYVAALVPSTGVGFLFYLIIKAMIEGDRRERRALAQWEAANPQTEPSAALADPSPAEADSVGVVDAAPPSDTGDGVTDEHPAPELNGQSDGVPDRTGEHG